MNLQRPQDPEDQEDHDDHQSEDKSRSNKNKIKAISSLRNSSTPASHLIFRGEDAKKFANNSNEKIFIIIGGYDDMKEALKSRGWIENTNPQSLRFDFKWTLKVKDIEYNKLKEHQIVNHFEKNSCITSKVGVCRNLKNLIGSDCIDIDGFYPRCYDLDDANEFEDFIEEFKFTRAEAIIKEFAKFKNGQLIDKNRELIVKTAIAVVARKILDVYEKIHLIVNRFLFSYRFIANFLGVGSFAHCTS